jgi:PII-like signaling protein
MIPADAHLLRLYINGSDRWEGAPLYQAVVETARELHLAGASVFLVDLSYGAHRRLRDRQDEYRFVDVPVVVEVVDALERIDALLDRLSPMMASAFITIEPVRVVHYGHHLDRPESATP